MSSQKRSANETVDNGAVKKRSLSQNKIENIELNCERKMNLVVKSPTEVLETPDKSESDKKSYRVIRLENGLKALLVSDPSEKPIDFSKCNDRQGGQDEAANEAASVDHEEHDDRDDHDDESGSDDSDAEEDNGQEKTAAFALAVHVGSFSDPRDIQGLSHFLGELTASPTCESIRI